MGFSTMLLIMFMSIFLIFRVVVAIMTQMGFDLIGITSWNLNYEIILIFLALVCILLIIKRKLLL